MLRAACKRLKLADDPSSPRAPSPNRSIVTRASSSVLVSELGDANFGGAFDLGNQSDVSGALQCAVSSSEASMGLHADQLSSFSEPNVGVDIAEGSSVKKRRQSFLFRKLSNPSDPELSRPACAQLDPPMYDSIRYWVDPLLNAAAPFLERLKLLWKPRIFSVCSGTGAEFAVKRALGIPYCEGTGQACEPQRHLRQFMVRNFASDLEHVWVDMAAMTRKAGECESHGASHVYRVAAERSQHMARPELLTGGAPCPAYSSQRGNQDEVPTASHPMYKVLFGGPETEGGSYLETVRKLRPLGCILEEVIGFTHIPKGESESACQKYARELQRISSQAEPDHAAVIDVERPPLYTAIKVFIMEAQTWMNATRGRLYVVALSDELGGELGMQSISEIVRAILSYRSKFPPTDLTPKFLESLLAKELSGSSSACPHILTNSFLCYRPLTKGFLAPAWNKVSENVCISV
jgi:hypothetical protein